MPSNNKAQVYQVNLKEHIEQYAWKRFRETQGFFSTLFMRKNRYYVDIRWGYMKFDHKTTEHPRPKIAGDADNKNVELYYCKYENKTDDEQTHKFSTSRETTTSTSVEFQENYTIGAETNIEVDLGFITAGGGVNGGLSVTETNGQSYSETITWNIDTEIKVPKQEIAIAALHVSEDPRITDFDVETTVTLPKKRMPVSIRRISDDKLMGQTIWIQNLDAIFDETYLKRNKHLVEVKEIDKEVGGKTYTYIALLLKSHGTAQNISFKNQNVTVQCMTREEYEEWKKNKDEEHKKNKDEDSKKNKDEESKKETAEASSKKDDE